MIAPSKAHWRSRDLVRLIYCKYFAVQCHVSYDVHIAGVVMLWVYSIKCRDFDKWHEKRYESIWVFAKYVYKVLQWVWGVLWSYGVRWSARPECLQAWKCLHLPALFRLVGWLIDSLIDCLIVYHIHSFVFPSFVHLFIHSFDDEVEE